MTRLRHYDNLGTARFITLSCYHNYNLLNSRFAKITFIKHLTLVRQKYEMKLYGYVIMPNHIHLVLLPPKDSKLGRIVGELKSLSAKEILSHWREENYKVLEKTRNIEAKQDAECFLAKTFL